MTPAPRLQYPVPGSRLSVSAVLYTALLLASPARAQVPASTAASLKLIFDSTYFDTQRFGPARWIENGAAYTTVERSAETKRGQVEKHRLGRLLDLHGDAISACHADLSE